MSIERKLVALLAVAMAVPLGARGYRADATDATQGTRQGEVCVFATEVRVPAGFAVHADDACRLTLTPSSGSYALTRGRDGVPKTPARDDGIGQRAAGVDAVTGLGSLDVATGWRTKIAFSELVVHDDVSRVLYDDSMAYLLQRRASDGAMRSVTPYEGVCRTPTSWHGDLPPDPAEVLAGPLPYQPFVTDCWSDISVQRADRLVWDSYGWYGTTIGAFGLGIRRDYRNMGEHWVGDKSGFRSDQSECDLGGTLLPPWWYECVMGESLFDGGPAL
jgi:hypothetical protein